MNILETSDCGDNWHCGGWEGAEMATYQHMMSLTFEEKIAWLEGAQEMVAAMHGQEAPVRTAAHSSTHRSERAE